MTRIQQVRVNRGKEWNKKMNEVKTYWNRRTQEYQMLKAGQLVKVQSMDELVEVKEREVLYEVFNSRT